MNVRESMTARPRTVTPDTDIDEAQAIMRRGRFRHLPVVEGDTLVGIVSERDLHVADVAAAELGHRPVRAVMTANPVTINPDDPVEEAARLMLENKFSCLPVVEGAVLAGVITESDIFRAFVDVLGVMEPGTRVEMHAGDLATALAGVAGVAQSQNVRIVAVVSKTSAATGGFGLVVRFGTVMIGPLIAALRGAGLDVRQPDPTRPA